MTWKQLFTSSLGKKYVMGLTGLFLTTFLLVHVGVNACIFLNDGGETFNTAAKFMSHNWIVRILEIGLFAGFFLHIIQGLLLWSQNNKARPEKYAVVDASKNSKWYSRSMGLLGTLLLLFLVMHINHFWIGTKASLYLHDDAPHDTYTEMKEIFSKWYWVALYLLGVLSLSFHLMHGFHSAFQSIGLKQQKFASIFSALGFLFSIIIPILFAAMPILFYFQILT